MRCGSAQVKYFLKIDQHERSKKSTKNQDPGGNQVS